MGWFFLVMSSCGLVNFYIHGAFLLPAEAGGIVGDLAASSLALLFNKTGSTLLFFTTLLCGITLVTGLSWLGVVDLIGERFSDAWYTLRTQRETKVAANKLLPKSESINDKIKKPLR